jgi:hypothetical protein
MNVVKFNEPFERLLSMEQKLGGFVGGAKKWSEALKKAPLFQFHDGLSMWYHNEFSHDENSLPFLPFPNVRIAVITEHRTRVSDGQTSLVAKCEPDQNGDGTLRRCYRIFARESTPSPISRVINTLAVLEWEKVIQEGKEVRSGDHIRDWVIIGQVFKGRGVMLAGGQRELSYVSNAVNLSRQHLFSEAELKSIIHNGNPLLTHIHHINEMVIEELSRLAVDMTNPNLKCVRVCPRSVGRSVEWREARQHFIFIHSRSAMNTKGATGQNFDSKSELIRASHARRAHYRLLTSGRYKNKQGQRVLVKACWVGPKEWEDSSGQVYRIIEHPFNPKLN